MTTTQWHADATLLSAYIDGRLDAVVSASLERHVDACSTCRSQIAPLVALPARSWDAIRTEIDSPRVPWLFRRLQDLGLGEPNAILLAVSASMRAPWLVGTVVALCFAVLATVISGGQVLWPFLLVAPLIPVLGVAFAYESADEPFESLVVSTPFGRPRLILLRALGVIVTSVPVATLLGLVLPGPGWVAIAWLGPALAMLPITFALAGFIGPRYAGSIVTLAWVVLVIVSDRVMPMTWPIETTQQLGYLALAASSGLVIYARSHATRRIGIAL